MHYFTFGTAIAAVEDHGQAAKYEEAGWEKVSRMAFIAAWRARDRAARRTETAPLGSGTILVINIGRLLKR